MRAMYGRTSNGASTCPTKTFAVIANPAGPVVPRVRSNSHAIARITTGSTRQYHSTADSAEETMMIGITWNANTASAGARSTANGGGPPPRYPNTNAEPWRVA